MKKIIKNTVFFLAMAIAVAGCNGSEKDENGCNFKDPIKDLRWLRKFVEEYDSRSIKPAAHICQCTYKDGLTGFYCDYVGFNVTEIVLFDCKGNKLEIFNDTNFWDMRDIWNVQNDKIIWKYPKNK